ncbi:MAG: hypothetical protein KA403_10095 [Candidatus Omnitrophica bacterium]|nr:hypothetical protein [Candidatus Omnitrophota bacterium]
MFDIFVMLFFFLVSVFIHLVICRKWSKGGLLLKHFFSIALLNLILLWAFFWMTGHYGRFDQSSVLGVRLYGTATLIYLLLIPTYLVFYFSTQQMSPSKKLLLLLSRNGSMSREELFGHFSDEEFILPRIKELAGIRCIVEHGGWYVLTPTGIQMAKVYVLYQAVLGRNKGG